MDSPPDYRSELLARVPHLVHAPDFPCSLFTDSLRLHREFLAEEARLHAIRVIIETDGPDASLYQSLITVTSRLCFLHDLERDLNLAIAAGVSRRPFAHLRFRVTPAIVSHLFDSFLNRDPPLVDPPFGPLCGKIPLPNEETVPPRTVVCARNGDDYALFLLLQSWDDGTCEVCVLQQPIVALKTQVLRRENLVPFPGCLPREVGGGCDFAIGDPVIAVSTACQDRGRRGVVAAAPAARGDGYQVKFDDSNSVEQVRERCIAMSIQTL
jgi:hypothetical protein